MASAPTPRRKACVECRQQKIRCDVEQSTTHHEPCSRCRRMGLECIILPTSTRNLRQTKAEMRRELEELRWNMRHAQEYNMALQTPMSVPSVEMQNMQNMQNFGHIRQSSVPYSTSQTPISAPQTPPFDEVKSVTSHRTSPNAGPTLPRLLDGFAVDSKRIDDCFALFFSSYHSLLPILEPSYTPNEYYDLSPFLFWSIVITGSRRYAEDPTLLDTLSSRVVPLAFSSMTLRSNTMPVIQGLLVLCNWRLPANSVYKDLAHVLVGAAVHLATLNGLHVAGVGQDFSRTVVEKDQHQMILRAKLWVYCTIVSIRSSCIEGIPPLVIADTFYDGDVQEREQILEYLPPSLRFTQQVHVILLRGMLAIARLDLKTTHPDARVLRSIISIFDSQFAHLETQSPGELQKFQLNCARIHLLCFHFFCSPHNPDLEALARVYSLCVEVIETAAAFDQQQNFASVSPSFIDRTITLAAFAVLKLSRSPLSPHLDLPSGEHAYFAAVEYTKKTSLQQNDIGMRCAGIMVQLWNSAKVFRTRDGSIESLSVRLRERFSMSVTFDMFWWWRTESENVRNPYGEENALPPGSTVQTVASSPQGDPNNPNNHNHNHNHNQPQSLGQQLSTASASTPSQNPAADPTSSTNPNPTTSVPELVPPVDPALGFDPWSSPDFMQASGAAPVYGTPFPDYDWAASFDVNAMQVQGPPPTSQPGAIQQGEGPPGGAGPDWGMGLGVQVSPGMGGQGTLGPPGLGGNGGMSGSEMGVAQGVQGPEPPVQLQDGGGGFGFR